MKQIINMSLLAAFVIECNICYSQAVASPYEVGTWHGFRQTAINYTFDDGCSNQFAIAIPLFNQHDFDLTLFTVIDWGPDWTTMQSVAAQGHEIASHTLSHANFSTITSDQQRAELKDSKSTIESHITGQPCITMAYPYCATGVDSICSKYYIAARGCQGFIESATPGSFMNISSIICGSLGSVKTVRDFKARFESAAAAKGWCVFLLHGIDDDGGYSPVLSPVLTGSIEYLSIRRSKFWVTTFKNAALYAMERNAVTVTETLNTDTMMTLQVSDTLADSIFNHPLTLRRPLPENWPSADVTQNNTSVPTRIVQVDTMVYLMFDVVPDGGEVKLSKNINAVIPEIDTLPPDNDTIPQTYIPHHDEMDSSGKEGPEIMIIHNTLIVEMTVSAEMKLVITLYDLIGRSQYTQMASIGMEGRISINLPERFNNPGVYIVSVSDGNDTWSKKISVLI